MKDPFWIHGLSEAEKDLLRRSLEVDPLPHPPTAWGHLSPRTMGDPCPHCGGTEYYCAHMVDQVVGQENFDAVMKALGELYQEWCRVMREGTERSEIKYHSAKLMDAYNRWLG